MKSPFPGMDPYLESRWSDVHNKLTAFIGEALTPLLPPGLRARSEERILLETLAEQRIGDYRADVAVVSSPLGRGTAASASASAVADIEPVLLEYQASPEVDRFVRIIDTRNGNRVVTAIEVLSNWNKAAGKLNKVYLRKIRDYARAEVSVVEIDLLRSSRRRLLVQPDRVPPELRKAYAVCIRRGWNESQWAFYPIGLRDRLPRIPIPLGEGEPEVLLDLQPLIDRAYAAGGHDDIDYSVPPDPPLKGDDAACAAQLLAAFARPASGDASQGIVR